VRIQYFKCMEKLAKQKQLKRKKQRI